MSDLFLDDKDLEHRQIEIIDRPDRDALLRSKLYPHQLRGSEWMMVREKHPIRMVRGGCVFDDTGLGKTLQTLMLPLNDFIDDLKTKTLVVSPAHLVRSWESEIKMHLEEFVDIDTIVFHGKQQDANDLYSRLMYATGPVVVLTSLPMLSALWQEHNNPKATKTTKPQTTTTTTKPLTANPPNNIYKLFYETFWHRIVLDEAHHIRNAKTIQSQAMRALNGTCLWVLTATPVVNTVDDLFSLLNFLKAKPFIGPQAKRIWSRFVKRSSFHNMEQLRELLCSIGIRRTKQNTLSLPDLIKHTVHITLNEWQRNIYNAIWEYCQTRTDHLLQRFETIQQSKKNLNSNTAMDPNEASNLIKHTLSCALTQILRLKQCAVCPILCLKNIRWIKRSFSKNSLEILDFTTRHRLLDRLIELQTSPDNECPICFDDESDYMAEPCGHCCCRSCWEAIFKTTNKCPLCRSVVRIVNPVDVYMADVSNEETNHSVSNGPEVPIDPDAHATVDIVSAKINWLVEFIRNSDRNNGKIVVASQWVSLLDLVSKYLIQNGLAEMNKNMIVISGSNGSSQDRMKVVQRFQEDDNVQILLLSLSAGGEGITITEGSWIVMMDRWWNNQCEYQAISRLYRLGQKREVNVLMLHADDTIEDRIDEIIEHKGLIGDSIICNSMAKTLRAEDWTKKIQICLRRTPKDSDIGGSCSSSQWE